MTGTQWVGLALAVVCFGWLAVDELRAARRRRARRRSWSRHVDRALELAGRDVEQPRIVTPRDVVSVREWL